MPQQDSIPASATTVAAPTIVPAAAATPQPQAEDTAVRPNAVRPKPMVEPLVDSLQNHPDTLTVAQQVALDQMYDDIDAFTANIIADQQWLERQAAADKLYHERDTWNHGLDPVARPQATSQNSLLVGLILAILLLIAFNARHFRRVVGGMSKALFSIRRRENAFDEHTSAEARVLYILVVQLCLLLGVCLYTAMGIVDISAAAASYVALPPPTPLMLGVFSGLWLLYYLSQIVVYSLMGYTFADTLMSRNWLQGFRASQCLLSLALVVPTFVLIFYPSVTLAMLAIVAALYILARIFFIFKGFRIFYTNFSSLLYFILYLCALEIVPLIIIYVSARLSYNYITI